MLFKRQNVDIPSSPAAHVRGILATAVAGAMLVGSPVFAQNSSDSNDLKHEEMESVPVGYERNGNANDSGKSGSGSSEKRAPGAACDQLPSHGDLTKALEKVVEKGNTEANGGLGNNMWATVVDRSGVVCAVTYSGEEVGDQWPGSRGVSVSKASTANAFSLPGFALSTANLFWPSQPGNSLFGIASSTPLLTKAVYEGSPSSWGKKDDPLVGKRAGGVTVFAGGLALYDNSGKLLGGLGLSGDQSCTDHVIAWKVRHALNMDSVPKGVSKAKNDNIIYDIDVDPASGQKKSASGYGHPECSPRAKTIAESFKDKFPTGPEE
ncbi:heme-binding protein [Marinobacter salicampi]|uniref:heme-binding protein n=1 Tax=Marinobacter salicampi TaxID=435907 RepID=UPI001A9523D1|nr:heme-binding protein [Marinobacter salicampi]